MSYIVFSSNGRPSGKSTKKSPTLNLKKKKARHCHVITFPFPKKPRLAGSAYCLLFLSKVGQSLCATSTR